MAIARTVSDARAEGERARASSSRRYGFLVALHQCAMTRRIRPPGAAAMDASQTSTAAVLFSLQALASAFPSSFTSTTPSLTWPPAVAESSATTPSNGATKACSIFMASRVNRV